jgi:hypothetical protein
MESLLYCDLNLTLVNGRIEQYLDYKIDQKKRK